MSSMAIELVPARPEDFEDYYAVKCGASEIFWMGYDGIPAREKMYEVFMSRLGSVRFSQPSDKRINMIRVDGRNVGMIQFTLSEEGLEFGISIREDEQGKGYGTEGMKQAVRMAGQYADQLFAHIRDDNYPSQKALTRAGLQPTDDVRMMDFPQTGKVGYRKYVLQRPEREK